MPRDLKLKNKNLILGYASGVAASALFGSVPTIAKPLVSNANIFLLSSLVYLMASLAFTPLAQKNKIPRTQKDIGVLIIVSICGAAIAPLLYFLGLNQSTASDTSLLSNAEIVFTVLLAIIFFKERLKPVGFVAVGLVLFGVTIIATNLQVSSSLFQINSGHFLILAATALWALDNNLSRIISTRIDSARIVQLKYAIGSAVMFGIVFCMKIPFDITTTQIPYIVLLSVLGVGGSLYFFLQSLKRIGTIRTVVVFSTSSIFGLVFAGLILHEQISAFQIISIVIMLTGIYLINGKESIKENEPKNLDFDPPT